MDTRPGVAALALLASLALPGAAPAADAPASLTGVDLRKEHAARRAALAAALPEDSLAIVPAVRSDPSGIFTPRQEEDYAWLTGVDETDGVLLLASPPAKGRPPAEILLLPPRNPRGEVWVGSRLYPGKEAEEATGIAATADVRKAEEVLKDSLKGTRAVFLPRSGFAGEHAERLFGDLLRARKVPTQALEPILGRLRTVKSAEELARIRRAAEASAEGHRRAMAAARPGMAEFEVQAVLEEACRAGGCRRQAYDSIVGSGGNSCVLHYGLNRRILEEGDLVLVDAGGECLGYACDITRTWPAGAAFTGEQAKVYDAVLAAQAAGEAAARIGAKLGDVNDACRKVIKDRGLDAGWVHGTCHWVGRAVHDPNGDAPLAPGCVFTIEPGLYFPDRRLGVRIEDTYAVAADGTLECLSKDAPKERAAVEALRAAAIAGKR